MSAHSHNQEPHDKPRRMKLKAGYSAQLKRSIQVYLKEHSLSNTDIHYNRWIPYSTLNDWKKSLKTAGSNLKGKSGRYAPFKGLEQELFDAF